MKLHSLVVLVGLLSTGNTALAVEEPRFSIVVKDGDFEVRDHAATIVAEVTVKGDQKGAASNGFRLLAAYIFGGNTRRQAIAMTAPVEQVRTSETIAMTAPVTQMPDGGAWVVRFTMPAGYTLETLPRPNDPAVSLKEVAPARFAVLRFSGLAREASVAEKTAELATLLKARHLQAVGPVSLAQYNPPWTPWFMRRNEVMVPVQP